jgi:hypothetical protein
MFIIESYFKTSLMFQCSFTSSNALKMIRSEMKIPFFVSTSYSRREQRTELCREEGIPLANPYCNLGRHLMNIAFGGRSGYGVY